MKSIESQLSTRQFQENVDRELGAIFGSAIADAVGAGYEFSNGVESDLIPEIGPIGGGSFNWEPGQWTDDTEQAIALLEALRHSSINNVSHAAKNILDWYASDPIDIGITTRNVLQTAFKDNQINQTEAVEACFTSARNYANEKDYDCLHDSPFITTVQGCGSLMRLSSCALLSSKDEAEQWAVATSMITHGSVHVTDLASALGQIIWNASRLNGYSIYSIFDGVFDHLDEELKANWTGLTTQNYNNDSELNDIYDLETLIRFNGTAPGALACALSAIIHTTEIWGDYRFNYTQWFVSCIQYIVSQGGDTDSVAAIAGSIAGALVGYKHLPILWLHVLHGFDYDGNSLDEDDLIKLAPQATKATRSTKV